jgi:hypothetical protein
MESHSHAVIATPDLMVRVRAFISEAAESGGTDEQFNELALALFAFQFESVPIYRQFCEQRGARPNSVRHWSAISALPTSAFKEHVVSSLAETDRVAVFHSSGTTEQIPSRHFHSRESLSLYEASLGPWFERNFISDAMRGATFIFLTPPPNEVPHSSLVHMFETARRNYAGAESCFAGKAEADGSWTIDFEQVNAAIQSRPVAVLGTAFSFVHWLDFLAASKTRLRLPAGSRLMETGGYKGRSRAVPKAELHRLMTRHLGVAPANIVTEYGMSELSSQAYADVAGTFRFPPWARAQIISPETGAPVGVAETGLLRVFDPANIHSVMAIQTADLAAARADGFELLGRAEAAEPRGCSLMAAN